MHFAIGGDEGIILQGAECLLQFTCTKIHITMINLPHTMIKADAISATIAKEGCITSVILRIVHIFVAIHLKPVDEWLFWQTDEIAAGGKNSDPLHELIKAQLYIIIHHAMITNTA